MVDDNRKVVFMPNTAGKWYISCLLHEQHRNKVTVKNYGEHRFTPENDHKLFMGVDPIGQGATAISKRKSSLAAVVYRSYDDFYDVENSETFIADYLYRPDNPDDSYKDIL